MLSRGNVGGNRLQLLVPVENVKKAVLSLNKGRGDQRGGRGPSPLSFTEGFSGDRGGMQVLKAFQGLEARLAFQHSGNLGGQCLPWPTPANVCKGSRGDLQRVVKKGL